MNTISKKCINNLHRYCKMEGIHIETYLYVLNDLMTLFELKGSLA